MLGDGAGKKDKLLPKLCLTWDKDKNVAWERTAPGMPQQNGIVEQRIALLRNRAHAQFVAAGLKPEIINSLWAEAVSKVNVDEYVTCTSLMISLCTHSTSGK
jgi:hypothetical protein